MCECAFQALSTIVWDNGFAEWGRTAFMVNEKVPWGRMGEVLSMKWKSVCGADLTEDQLYSLACKALRYPPIQRNLWRTWPDFLFDFRNNNLHRHSYNDALISWQHLCKELLPDRTFTFWEWFHRAMDLTQVNESKVRNKKQHNTKNFITYSLYSLVPAGFFVEGGSRDGIRRQTKCSEFADEQTSRRLPSAVLRYLQI